MTIIRYYILFRSYMAGDRRDQLGGLHLAGRLDAHGEAALGEARAARDMQQRLDRAPREPGGLRGMGFKEAFEPLIAPLTYYKSYYWLYSYML